MNDTEDLKKWGKSWVYCNQHLRVHLTGWCTVGVENKTYICSGDNSEEKANELWKEMKNKI